MVQWRRRLHQIPETGLELPQTAAFVREKLDSFQIPYDTLVNGNCIVAHLGKGEGCLLLRADMDALPMKEETGLPFASQNDNMHACGHDLHAAALLAAAKILKSHEEDLKCAVKLMFQPAEEIFAGARSAIGEGVLENPQVDAAMVIHVDSTRATGNIAYGTQCNASVYGFKITLKGKGTHGAMPQDGIDSINAGVHSMASEDFAFVSERVPSSCFMIGAKPAEVQFPWAHHNPRVCFSEDAIPIAAAVYACAALSWQRQ